MAGGLGNLLITLTADTAQARSDIGKAAHQVERDMQDMQVAATAAGMLIATAVTEIGRAFINAGKEAIQFADQLNKMSQKTNFSVERLSEMAFAAELADVSIGQMNTGLGQFNKVLSDAAKEGSKASAVFKALGVDITQGPQVAFEQFARAINSIPDGETKVATMRAVFGRAGDALLPMIAGLDDATEKARKLGLTISSQMAADAEKFNDSMTVLGTTMRSLALTAMEPLVGWLSNVANGMAEAKANGNLFKNTLLEIAMFATALSGSIAEGLGLDMLGKQIEKEFNKLKALQENLRAAGATPGASGSWGDDGTKVNQGALGRAVSGIKDPKAKKTKDGREWLGRQLQEGMDEEAKIMAEAAAATDKYNQTLRDQDAEAIKQQVARAQSVIDMQEIIDQQTRMAHGWDENGRKISENTKEAEKFAKEMGLTFTSAFEDAIISGKKFSDVLRGIGQDLLQIAARKLVTEPLGDAFSGFIKTALPGLFGGGKAAGGPVSGGTTYLVGERGPELFTPGVSGNITPNHALGGGGGDTYNIDARGADRAGMDNLLAYIHSVNGSVERRAVAAVADTRRRGGSYARSMG